MSALCVFVLSRPLAEPPADTLVPVQPSDRGDDARRDTCPISCLPRLDAATPAVFTGRSTGARAMRGRAWSVFLPRFTNGVEVAVNGVVILDSRRDPSANRADRNTPEIVVIPAVAAA